MRPINAEKLEKQVKEAFKNNPDVLNLLVQWIEMQPTIDFMCADTGEGCIVGGLHEVATIHLYETYNRVTADMLYDGKWVEDHRTGLLLGVVRTLVGMARYSDNPQETRLLIEDMLKEEFKFGDGADEDEDANANTIEAKWV